MKNKNAKVETVQIHRS